MLILSLKFEFVERTEFCRTDGSIISLPGINYGKLKIYILTRAALDRKLGATYILQWGRRHRHLMPWQCFGGSGDKKSEKGHSEFNKYK